MGYQIAIDGPAGAGKSTIAKKVAKNKQFIYVDTGAMYRAIALYMLNNSVNVEDKNAVENAVENADVSIKYVDGEQVVVLNGENVNDYIRKEEVGNAASKIAAIPKVRERLTDMQRELAAVNSVVMDGRDIGTCVLPNADLKVYLTASSYVRALRRYKELKAKNIEADIEKIEKDIIIRDQNDMNREVAPLKCAEDATTIDSSEMTIDEVVNTILGMCK